MAKTAAPGRKRRKRKVNKAQAIRDEFGKQGLDARPRDVIAALSARKIKVSSAQVSNIKASMAAGGGTGRRGRKKAGAAGGVGNAYDALVEAKKLADRLGGVEAAKKALDVLSRLQ